MSAGCRVLLELRGLEWRKGRRHVIRFAAHCRRDGMHLEVDGAIRGVGHEHVVMQRVEKGALKLVDHRQVDTLAPRVHAAPDLGHVNIGQRDVVPDLLRDH